MGAILVPCTKCDHRNRIAWTKKEAVELLESNNLGNCKKCQTPLDSRLYSARKINVRCVNPLSIRY
jgi:hypothetical protein